LLSLPLEIRTEIWKLVLSPSVFFSIKAKEPEDDPNLPKNVNYIKRLRNCYEDATDEAARDYSKSPECESIRYEKYFHNHALLRTNKQVCSETASIMSTFSNALSGSIKGGMFEDNLQAHFLGILAGSKVFFD
jgi:hypothetical protein